MSDSSNGSGDHQKSADEAKERRKSRFLRHNKSRDKDHDKDKEEKSSPNGSKPTSNEFKIEEIVPRRDSHGHDEINKARSGSYSNIQVSPRKMPPPPHIPLTIIVRDYHTESQDVEHKVSFDADYLNSSEDVSAMESFSEASFSEKSYRERSGTTDTIDNEARKKRARAKHYR